MTRPGAGTGAGGAPLPTGSSRSGPGEREPKSSHPRCGLSTAVVISVHGWRPRRATMGGATADGGHSGASGFGLPARGRWCAAKWRLHRVRWKIEARTRTRRRRWEKTKGRWERDRENQGPHDRRCGYQSDRAARPPLIATASKTPGWRSRPAAVCRRPSVEQSVELRV